MREVETIPVVHSDSEEGSSEISAERRILDRGVSSLTDAELLSVLLRGGGHGRFSMDRAAQLLGESGGLSNLSRALDRRGTRVQDLLELPQRTLLQASFELSRRLARGEMPKREPMSHPAAVARYLALRFAHPAQEIMGALYLDTRNGLIRELEIYRGTLSRAAVEPRAVIKEGLLCDAAGFVLFHTHPSGDPSPSIEDLAFTRRIGRSGELVGVRLVDHLIVGTGGAWVSLRERRDW